MRQRTKVYQLRLTPEEAEWLKNKSKERRMTISRMIRSALEVYSNMDVRNKLEQINELGIFYKTYRNELSRIGGNLNQAVKRANELAAAGLLPPSYITEVLMPLIQETLHALGDIKRGLDNVTKKAVKL